MSKKQIPPFPTMLRKMWSGGEVQAWIDENIAPLLAALPSAEPVAYQYLYANPIDGSPVWRFRPSMWNGQNPKESRPLYTHPSPADEAVRRDAARYRWLLQECYRWPPAGRVCGREDQAQPVAIWTTFEGDDVDAAIDAALAAQQQEGSNGNA